MSLMLRCMNSIRILNYRCDLQSGAGRFYTLDMATAGVLDFKTAGVKLEESPMKNMWFGVLVSQKCFCQTLVGFTMAVWFIRI